MKHFTSPSFWACYDQLPQNIQKLADKNFELLKDNPQHPSLHTKKVGKDWEKVPYNCRGSRKRIALVLDWNTCGI